MTKKVPFSAVIKYRFDNFMSKGGASIFIALLTLFAVAFVIMAIVRFIGNYFLPDESITTLTDQLWRVFLQISDAGAVAEDGQSSALNKTIGIVTIFLGLILFSSLVAFITSQFEAMLDELKKGKSRVIEKKHTLILGFSDRTLEIVRELIIANESEKDCAVVVLAHEEKDFMDEYFREHVENRKTSRIITRSGLTSSMQTLSKMSISSAKSVVILNDVQPDADLSEKELADARVIKTIMATVACCRNSEIPPIIAELHTESKRSLARNISENVFLIEEHALLAKLIVQTSRISGLALVYDSLVGFDGCEFYFYAPHNGWSEKCYGDLQLHFNNCSVLGIREKSGKVTLNPPVATVLTNDMELLLIAEDDSVVSYQKRPFKPAKATYTPAPPLAKKPEQELVVGWSQKTSIIIDEYAEYLVEGSSIDLLVPEIFDEMKEEFEEIQKQHSSITMRLIEANPQSETTMKQIRPEQYDNVIILKQDGGDPELRDSETITLLLQFRQHLHSLPESKVKTQLISEVADSDNIDVILEVGVNDFLISNKFVSKLYAQVSEEPDVLQVYNDLFNEAGSEIYIKPLGRFMNTVPSKIKFGDLCVAAQQRGESCFGVRIKSQESDPSENYGMYINPSKDEVFTLSLDDSLLTLAEDES